MKTACGDPWPYYYGPSYYQPYWQPIETSAAPHTRALSIQEQMGTDPISKLATAIEKLAEALERNGK